MELKLPETFTFDPGHEVPQEHWDSIYPPPTPPHKIKKHCVIERDNISYFTRQRRGRCNE